MYLGHSHQRKLNVWEGLTNDKLFFILKASLKLQDIQNENSNKKRCVKNTDY